MKRLVTQFDDRRIRATVATPTCCCCCCCCIASVLTSTGLTVRNVQVLAKRSEMPARASRPLLAGAVIAMPVAVFVGACAGAEYVSESAWVTLIVAVAVWSAILWQLYGRVGQARRAIVIAVTVVTGAGLFVAELYLGLEVVFEVRRGGSVYLLSAFALPFLLVPLMGRLTVGKRS